MNKLLCSVAVAAIASMPLTAGAVTTIYSLNLAGTQEVPVNLSPAAGSAQVTVDDASGLISFALVAFNLQGAFSASHIHGQALAGVNAPVVYNFGANADSSGLVTIGSFSVPNSEALAGTNKAIDLTLAAAINAKPWLYYVNLHTATYPGGEIRGQLAPVPEPATYALAALGLGVVGWAARRRRRPA